MVYTIAGIDVHKKMWAVVVADVEVEGDFHFEHHKVGTSPDELRALAGWLVERQVDEVVMESTAQYWRPVWEALELHWRRPRRTHDGASPLSGTLHLAQAQSNRGTAPRGSPHQGLQRGLRSGLRSRAESASAARAEESVSPSAKPCSMRRALNDLLSGVNAQALDLGESMDRVVMVIEELRHLLIELSKVCA